MAAGRNEAAGRATWPNSAGKRRQINQKIGFTSRSTLTGPNDDNVLLRHGGRSVVRDDKGQDRVQLCKQLYTCRLSRLRGIDGAVQRYEPRPKIGRARPAVVGVPEMIPSVLIPGGPLV